MKHLLLTISIFFSINCFAQQANPDLFRTWFLHEVMLSDGNQPIDVSEIDPAVIPTITINQDMTFDGTGACNTFDGKFELTNSANDINTLTFNSTSNDCGNVDHNDLEYQFFSAIDITIFYDITTLNNGNLRMDFTTPPFGYAIFKEFPLSTTNFEANQFKIYPNPTNSLIHLESDKSPINKVEIFNHLGQSLKEINNNFETINIAELSSGIYFMKIYSETGTHNKKIIKE